MFELNGRYIYSISQILAGSFLKPSSYELMFLIVTDDELNIFLILLQVAFITSG